MSKLVKVGVDLYEQQIVWVRIFESVCKVSSAKSAPGIISDLEDITWEIYDGLTLSALPKARD